MGHLHNFSTCAGRETETEKKFSGPKSLENSGVRKIMGDFLSFKTLNTDDELSAAEESEDETSQATDYDDKVGKV